MDRHPLYTVDVFARQRYTGNQLAVVTGAADLPASRMQRIAREMAYSETTFVGARTDTGRRVRIFTPETELPFAGHPTLGTAHVLREYVREDTPTRVVLDLDVGPTPVTVETGDHDRYWMTQQPPTVGPAVDRERAATALDLAPGRLDDGHEPRVLSTGVPTLVVPADSLEAVRAASVDPTAAADLAASHEVEAVLVFAPETVEPGTDLHVRVFAPVIGVHEDPATGSANGCLAAYLAREAYFGTRSVERTVEQGYELDRPSLLRLRADATGDDTTVSVGGRVLGVSAGELL
jgi:trans-2,3-dihydro-3-hydroxyanthranilate isomerase